MKKIIALLIIISLKSVYAENLFIYKLSSGFITPPSWSITEESLSDAIETNLYNQSLSSWVSSDMPITINWSLQNEPSWLSINSEGLLSGTPPSSSAGSYSFDILATYDNQTRSFNKTLTVNPNCVDPNNVGSISDGEYEICGVTPPAGAYTVISNNTAFLVESVSPYYAFSCSNGLPKYYTTRPAYANDSEARKIANSLNLRVYTPYDSFEACTRSQRCGTTTFAKGRATDVSPSGVYTYNEMKTSYNSYSTSYTTYAYVLVKGTTTSLNPDKSISGISHFYDAINKSPSTSKPAYRACVIK